jgi:hypothetical protein
LAASVGLGEVGIILALEVSRFARSSADWHRLLELCALTGTLIADQDGVYSPGDFNDRLLLGLKGTMSEAELHLIRARLDGGLRHKAERGELALSLPIGLDRDDEGRIVLAADENSHGGGVASTDVLDHRLLQERAVERGGPLPEARESHRLDVEGGDSNDAGTVADHRLLRLLRVAANVVRRHINMRARRPLRLLAAAAQGAIAGVSEECFSIAAA